MTSSCVMDWLLFLSVAKLQLPLRMCWLLFPSAIKLLTHQKASIFFCLYSTRVYRLKSNSPGEVITRQNSDWWHDSSMWAGVSMSDMVTHHCKLCTQLADYETISHVGYLPVTHAHCVSTVLIQHRSMSHALCLPLMHHLSPLLY